MDTYLHVHIYSNRKFSLLRDFKCCLSLSFPISRYSVGANLHIYVNFDRMRFFSFQIVFHGFVISVRQMWFAVCIQLEIGRLLLMVWLLRRLYSERFPHILNNRRQKFFLLIAFRLLLVIYYYYYIFI